MPRYEMFLERLGQIEWKFNVAAGMAVVILLFVLEIIWLRKYRPRNKRVEQAEALGHVVRAKRIQAWDDDLTRTSTSTSSYVHATYLYEVDGKEYRMTCISMGNPHAVVFVDCDVRELPLEEIGPKFENHERFPKRVNTEFVRVLDRHTAEMRVWERGSGETLACGTGACAVAVACALNGLTEDEVTVKLLGGDLHIRWDRENDTVYMTGPAEVVFDGEWPESRD